MSIKIIIEPQILAFDWSTLEIYRNENNTTNGFGENLAIAHYEKQGYECIQHE
jgi:hypothetical protein